MSDNNKYSRESGFACEYDNYPIPPHDPAITQEMSEQRANEAKKELARLAALARKKS